MTAIDPFRMERYQSLHWHEVEFDLSESGVRPLTVAELLGDDGDPAGVLAQALGYPLSEGSAETRASVASWYEGATERHVTVVNGGSEANLLVLWSLLGPDDRLAFMVPNYMQGAGLGRHFGAATDTFELRLEDGRWRLDLEGLERAVGPSTKVVMVCNPNNPTGDVLTEEEIDAVVAAAERVGAWIVADEIYRGAELAGDALSPTLWGRSDRVVVTSGLSKAFAMPGLRIGWVVAAPEAIERVWERHDYTTLTPGMLSDQLAGFAMRPDARERVLARTRAIVREQLPSIEAWIREHESLTYVAPEAGAIVYVPYDLPVDPTTLAERARLEQSVLLVPGDMFGFGGGGERGFRLGFGYDVEATLKALARLDEVLASVASG